MRYEDEAAATAPPGGAPAGGDGELTYPSMPFAYTQPAHLAAIAALHGFAAPDAGTARVLELGCASGGNIVPLAARFPEASFLGVEISRRDVAAGRRRIAALGLSNVEIRQGDLAEVALRGACFDYVICHGVFSWVPRNVQEAIFRICSEGLAPNGVAVISYNVLPGWHLRMVVRDICLHYADAGLPPQERVDRARQVLGEIAESGSDRAPYGLLLRTEAKRIAKLPSAYILGEFLAAHNDPCHFDAFAARAGQHGLSYLCEGDLASSCARFLPSGAGPQITRLAGDNRLKREQSVDFLTGRPFRRSVLVRSQAAARVADWTPSPGLLRPLHVASEIRLDTDRSKADLSVFRDSRGRTITVGDPAVRHALKQLGEHHPATRSVAHLAAASRCDPAAEARVCEAIFRLAVAGQAALASLPLQVGRAAQKKPRAWPLPRIEAAAGQPWVTSLRHTPVPSGPALAFLLARLDGQHDRPMLTAKLVDALQRGEVPAPEIQHGGEPMTGLPVDAAAGQYVAKMLAFCDSHALLAPSPA